MFGAHVRLFFLFWGWNWHGAMFPPGVEKIWKMLGFPNPKLKIHGIFL
jgi:hypothetical protein